MHDNNYFYNATTYKNPLNEVSHVHIIRGFFNSYSNFHISYCRRVYIEMGEDTRIEPHTRNPIEALEKQFSKCNYQDEIKIKYVREIFKNFLRGSCRKFWVEIFV